MNIFDTSVEIGLLNERISRLASSDLQSDRDQMRLLEDERQLFALSPHLLYQVDSVTVHHVTIRAQVARRALNLLNIVSSQDETVALLVRSELWMHDQTGSVLMTTSLAPEPAQ